MKDEDNSPQDQLQDDQNEEVSQDKEAPVVVEEIEEPQVEEKADSTQQEPITSEEEDEGEEFSPKKKQKKQVEKPQEPETTADTGGQDVQEEALESPKNGYSTKSLVFMFIAGAVLSGLVMGGILYFNSNIPLLEKGEVEETLIVSQQEPTPTQPPAKEADLSQFKIQILNGSGVSGIAKSTRDVFEEEGFEMIDIGNAASQDYQETEVSFKEDVDTQVSEMIKQILSDYVVVEGEPLAESSNYDIIVTIGRKKSS